MSGSHEIVWGLVKRQLISNHIHGSAILGKFVLSSMRLHVRTNLYPRGNLKLHCFLKSHGVDFEILWYSLLGLTESKS